ncbi:hypothetical protein AT15_02690 [Kosmotoga arenicorallina S304]|uniref:Nucleoid-associated protein AT15_02690 n=1 Tax=Kosmotoga arenicorallina S304 TaxID=1453497 RepID=A0A176K3Z3_9BACT|nr:YbaB/EbfC family nucleoid-associated protein [Kosmotoga arenicorallina]OAA31751.1 hypothetical protein AT15_02690 [Kosmotoga arenicorallina S304]
MAKKIKGFGGRSYGQRSKKSGNLNELLKQAQKAQEQMENLEETFKEIEITATAGGGAVTVVATCDYKIKSIEIDDEIKDEEFEIVQDLIVAGVNEALEEIKKRRDEEYAKVTGSMGLPEDIM